MTDRCPECGRKLGTLMETHPDQPWPSWALSAIVLLVCLAVIGGYAVLR